MQNLVSFYLNDDGARPDRSVKKNCVVIHSPLDQFRPFEDSLELCGKSGPKLVPGGLDCRFELRAGEEGVGNTLFLGRAAFNPFATTQPRLKRITVKPVRQSVTD